MPKTLPTYEPLAPELARRPRWVQSLTLGAPVVEYGEQIPDFQRILETFEPGLVSFRYWKVRNEFLTDNAVLLTTPATYNAPVTVGDWTPL